MILGFETTSTKGEILDAGTVPAVSTSHWSPRVWRRWLRYLNLKLSMMAECAAAS
jgi:hypothetical protein